jgi:hypothetical protein
MHITNAFDQLLGRDSPAKDRRRSPRYPTVQNWACLAWREGGRTRESTARLLNMSSVGACVLTNDIPVVHETVWLRLEEPTPTQWVEATVVRRSGPLKFGLNFVQHCPNELFEVVSQPAQNIVALPPEFEYRHWR